MRRGPVVWIVVAGVALAGVGYLVFKPEPFKLADYEKMCESPRGFPEAAAYEGAAPHPVKVATGRMSMKSDDPEKAAYFPDDPAAVQLVSCVTRVGRGPFVKRCEYTLENNSSGTVVRTIDLYRGIHTITVYEARTGNKLAESKVEGKGFIGNSMKEESDPCQDFLRVKDPTATRSSQTESEPSVSQVREFLAPHVRRKG